MNTEAIDRVVSISLVSLKLSVSTCPSSEVSKQKGAVNCRPVLEQAMQCFILTTSSWSWRGLGELL